MLSMFLGVDAGAIPKSDVHLHMVDFLQNGEYWTEEEGFVEPAPNVTLPQGQRGARVVAVLKRMQAANVDYAMVTGLPFFKRWDQTDTIRSKYYLDSNSRAVQARDTDYVVALAFTDFMANGGSLSDRKKLFPFVSGFDATDMGAVDMVVKRIKEFPGLWEGIGEVMSHHDDLTSLSVIEQPRGDHPALHRLSDFAGAVHLPVSIHHNMAPVSSDNSLREPIYLKEIEDLFDAHPDTRFIWCHAGISRRINVANLPDIIRSVLNKKGRRNHVYIDLSWVVFENYIYREPTDNEPVRINNVGSWTKLISDFKNNFMIGSDLIGNFTRYTEVISKYDPLLDALEKMPNGDMLVKRVAHDNFADLMNHLRKQRGGLGVTLPKYYLYPEDNYNIKKVDYVRQDPTPRR
jgi:hypothetical protein